MVHGKSDNPLCRESTDLSVSDEAVERAGCTGSGITSKLDGPFGGIDDVVAEMEPLLISGKGVDPMSSWPVGCVEEDHCAANVTGVDV